MSSTHATQEQRFVRDSRDEIAWPPERILLLGILLLLWITTIPFSSLVVGSDAIAGETSNVLNQVAYVAVAVVAITVAIMRRPIPFAALLRPAYLPLILWFALTCVTSIDPALSMKRAIFTGLVIAIAAAAITLPRSADEFCRTLSILAMVVLAMCFAGIMLVPSLAIHQSGDTIEPHLAGSWRGHFPHKNAASAMMAILVFVGMFAIGLKRWRVGGAIVILATIFLIGSGGKTALAILLPVLLVSAVAAYGRNLLVGGLIGLLLVIAFNLSTFGSAYLPAAKAFNEAVLPDPTYTGRSEIWQFVRDKITERPWLGVGYGAYWLTSGALFADEGLPEELAEDRGYGTWVNGVWSAHSLWAEMTLTIGLPGMLMVAVVFLVCPLWDMARISRARATSPLALLFFRIWLFTVLLASVEVTLLNREDPLGFMAYLSVFGLYLMTKYNVTTDAIGSRAINKRQPTGLGAAA